MTSQKENSHFPRLSGDEEEEHLPHVVGPSSPDMVTFIESHGERAGRTSADLRFERRSDGSVQAQVLDVDGSLDIVIEA